MYITSYHTYRPTIVVRKYLRYHGAYVSLSYDGFVGVFGGIECCCVVVSMRYGSSGHQSSDRFGRKFDMVVGRILASVLLRS